MRLQGGAAPELQALLTTEVKRWGDVIRAARVRARGTGHIEWAQSGWAAESHYIPSLIVNAPSPNARHESRTAA